MFGHYNAGKGAQAKTGIILLVTAIVAMPVAWADEQIVTDHIIMGTLDAGASVGTHYERDDPFNGTTHVWIVLAQPTTGHESERVTLDFSDALGTADLDVRFYDQNEGYITFNKCSTSSNPESCKPPSGAYHADVVAITGENISFLFNYTYPS